MRKKLSSTVLKLLRGNQRLAHRINTSEHHFSPFSTRQEDRKFPLGVRGKLISDNVLSDAKNLIERMPFPFVRKSMKTLMSKEFKTVTKHFAKIVGSGHPIVKTTQQVLKSKNSAQTRKLIVLLISDLMSTTSTQAPPEEKETYTKNLSLAELTELLYIAFLLQRGLINMIQTNIQPNLLQDFELGNKMAVLGGDFLLAKATVMLSQLENSVVLGLMASAVRDMSHGLFTLPEQREHFDDHLIRNIPCSVQDWQQQNSLAHSSLLSNACRAVTVLHRKDQQYGDIYADFGHHLTLAQEARSDIERIVKSDPTHQVDISTTQFFSELCSLPSAVVSERKGSANQEWINSFLIREDDKFTRQTFSLKREKFLTTILMDKAALDRCEQVCGYHAEAALSALHTLPQSEARECLEKLTLSFI